jgi:hypothetical protein
MKKIVFLLCIFAVLFYTIPASADSTVDNSVIVKEAIELKKLNIDTPDVIDQLYHTYRNKETPFGQVDLTSDETKELLGAGYDSEFVRKMKGVPDYVKLGVSAVYLKEANDVIGAVTVRFLLYPRPFFNNLDFYKTPRNFWRRFDLIVGMTSKSNKAGENKDQERAFYLAGLSWQIVRGAYINYGLAFTTEGTFKEDKQEFVGLTLDESILKHIGWIDK